MGRDGPRELAGVEGEIRQFDAREAVGEEPAAEVARALRDVAVGAFNGVTDGAVTGEGLFGEVLVGPLLLE